MSEKYYYRVDEDYYSGDICLLKYKVIKNTPCGVKIRLPGYNKEKFICNHWVKQWASSSIEQAKKAFTRRKTLRLQYIKREAEHIERLLSKDISVINEEKTSTFDDKALRKLFN